MAIYDVKRLLTATSCDAALKTASTIIGDLKFKQKRSERRIEVHHRVASKTQEDLQIRQIELTVLKAGLSKCAEGRLAREYRCKITRTRWRIQLLQLRLEDYSEQALLMKTLKLRQVTAALREAELFMAQIEAHRTGLQAALEQPVLTVPFAASLKPAQEPKETTMRQTKGQPVKKKRKRLPKPREGFNGYWSAL